MVKSEPKGLSGPLVAHQTESNELSFFFAQMYCMYRSSLASAYCVLIQRLSKRQEFQHDKTMYLGCLVKILLSKSKEKCLECVDALN